MFTLIAVGAYFTYWGFAWAAHPSPIGRLSGPVTLTVFGFIPFLGGLGLAGDAAGDGRTVTVVMLVTWYAVSGAALAWHNRETY